MISRFHEEPSWKHSPLLNFFSTLHIPYGTFSLAYSDFWAPLPPDYEQDAFTSLDGTKVLLHLYFL